MSLLGVIEKHNLMKNNVGAVVNNLLSLMYSQITKINLEKL